MKSTNVPSFNALNGLKKLGVDVSTARKRRKVTQQRLADGAGVTVATIRRLEKGDPGVSLATLAMVLVVLGEGNRLANLLDAGDDDIGLMLDTRALPKRVRVFRHKPSLSPAAAENVKMVHEDDGFGEAF